MHFCIEEIINLTEKWLVKGDLNPDMLADNFQFKSPFWKGNNKAEFVAKFLDTTEYKKVSLSNIIKFYPILQFSLSVLIHASRCQVEALQCRQ